MKRDACLAMVANTTRSVGRMAVMLLIARDHGLGAAGSFAIAVTIETILVGALNALFVGPCSVIGHEKGGAKHRAILHESERLQTICTGVVFVAGLLLALVWYQQALYIASFTFFLSATLLYQARRGALAAAFRSAKLVGWELVISAGTIVAVTTAALLSFDLVTVFWTAQATLSVIAVCALRSGQPQQVGRADARWARRQIWSHGTRMLSGSVALSLGSRMHPFVIGAMLGTSALGVFAIAMTFSAPMRMLGGSLRGALLPHYANEHAHAGRVRICRGHPLVMLALACVVVLGQSVLGLILIRTMLDDAAREAIPYIVPLGIAALLASVAGLYAARLQAQGLSRRAARVRWVIALISPIAVCASAPVGLPGVVMASVVIEALALGLMVRAGSSAIHRPLSNARSRTNSTHAVNGSTLAA